MGDGWAPKTGDDWFRWVEGELRSLRRHRHGGAVGGLAFGSSATIQFDEFGNRVWNVEGQTSAFSTASRDVTPPPQPSQPTTTVRLGVVTLMWDGLAFEGQPMPADLRHVQVHRSMTPDFYPADNTLIGFLQPGGDLLPLPDQEYNSVWYYRLVAMDKSGNLSPPSVVASATTTPLVSADIIGEIIDGANIVDGSITASDKVIANTITSALIQALAIKAVHLDANSVQAQHIEAGSIDAEKLAALLVLSSKMASSLTGQRWEADQYGVRLYASDDSLIVNLPTDPETPATFYGDVLARSLTVADQFALHGLMNEISRGARLTLAVGVTAPSSPPAVVVGWETVNLPNPYSGLEYYDDVVRHGWARNGSYYYTCQATASGNGKIRRYDASTGAVDPSWIITSTSLKYLTGGCTFIGDTLYVMGRTSPSAAYYSIEAYNITTLARTDYWQWPGQVARWPALGTKSTNLVIAYWRDSLEQLEIEERTPAGAAVTLYTSTDTWYDNVSSVSYGTFDYGANRFVVTYENRGFDLSADPHSNVFSVSGTTLTKVDNQTFPVPSRTVGMCWDATLSKFVRLQDNLKMVRHTGITWTTESSKWWLAHTWYDSNATGGTHETDRGPRRSFTMRKRAQVDVTVPPIPPTSGGTDDVTAAKLYLARGATDPARTDMQLQATLADGVTHTALTTASFTVTTPPPATNNFPGGASAEIRSLNERFSVKGDSSGNWGGITWGTNYTHVNKTVRLSTPTLITASTTTQNVAANTSVLISWPTATVNDDTWTLASDIWTCPRDGTYTAYLQVTLGTNVTGTDYAWLMIYADTLDGTLHGHGFLPPNTNSTEFECVLPNLRMESTDTLYCYVRSSVTNTITAKHLRVVRTGGGLAT